MLIWIPGLFCDDDGRVLCTICAKSIRSNRTHIVAYLFSIGQSKETQREFLQAFKLAFTSVNIFHCDQEKKQISNILEVFPEARITLCQAHLFNTFGQIERFNPTLGHFLYYNYHYCTDLETVHNLMATWVDYAKHKNYIPLDPNLYPRCTRIQLVV